jgi:hypothetical protein
MNNYNYELRASGSTEMIKRGVGPYFGPICGTAVLIQADGGLGGAK